MHRPLVDAPRLRMARSQSTLALLEREFQAKTAAGLVQAAETAAHPGEKAAMRYHAGELYRRLEQDDKARALFDQIRHDPHLPDFLKKFQAVVEQRMPKP